MSARGVPRRVVVTAHAKLNLGLAVGPRRPDGFHDLVTVFQSVSLADTLLAERTRHGLSLRVAHEDVSLRGRVPASARREVPAGGGNLVLRAAALVLARLGLPGGVRFRLTKRIPARAGLGGGSAAAAAAIAAVLALHGVRLGRARRIALAAELGSDVPFAVTGGTAVGLGRGERLSPTRLARPFAALVAVPKWRVSTPAAFRRLDKVKYDLTQWGGHLRSAASLGRRELTPLDIRRLGNSFERALGSRRRDFDGLCARLGDAGLLQPRLTGSGSGVFGILAKGASARTVSGRFAGDEQLFHVRSVRGGLRVQTMP